MREELCSGGRSLGRRPCPQFLTHMLRQRSGPSLRSWEDVRLPVNPDGCLISPPGTRKEMRFGVGTRSDQRAQGTVFLLLRRDAIWAQRSVLTAVPVTSQQGIGVLTMWQEKGKLFSAEICSAQGTQAVSCLQGLWAGKVKRNNAGRKK